jgi:thiol-disulfide isomerase/thioredoxin
MNLQRYGRLALVALLLLSGIGLGRKAFAGPTVTEPYLVVFTASWCASCRDVMPVLERLASVNNLPLVLIDVDEPTAPKQASQRGLAIPVKELPQVFVMQANRSSVLFDGEGYVLGHRTTAQQRINQRLTDVLGH